MRAWPVVKRIKRLGYKVVIRPAPEGIDIYAFTEATPPRLHRVRTLGDTAEQLYTAVCRLRELVRADLLISERSE
jgi:hypothetical protein